MPGQTDTQIRDIAREVHKKTFAAKASNERVQRIARNDAQLSATKAFTRPYAVTSPSSDPTRVDAKNRLEANLAKLSNTSSAVSNTAGSIASTFQQEKQELRSAGGYTRDAAKLWGKQKEQEARLSDSLSVLARNGFNLNSCDADNLVKRAIDNSASKRTPYLSLSNLYECNKTNANALEHVLAVESEMNAPPGATLAAAATTVTNRLDTAGARPSFNAIELEECFKQVQHYQTTHPFAFATLKDAVEDIKARKQIVDDYKKLHGLSDTDLGKPEVQDGLKQRINEYNNGVNEAILDSIKRQNEEQRAWLRSKYEYVFNATEGRRIWKMAGKDISNFTEADFLKAIPTGRISPGSILGVALKHIEYTNNNGDISMTFDPRMSSHREMIVSLAKQAGMKRGILVDMGAKVTAVGGNPYGTFNPANDPVTHNNAVKLLHVYVRQGFFDKELKNDDLRYENIHDLHEKINKVVEIEALVLTDEELMQTRQLIIENRYSQHQFHALPFADTSTRAGETREVIPPAAESPPVLG